MQSVDVECGPNALGPSESPNAAAAYDPPKTLYNLRLRWSRIGVFATIITKLAAQAQQTKTEMIDIEPGFRH